MNFKQTFNYNNIFQQRIDALNFYNEFGFLVINNVFNKKQCEIIKKRAFYLVNKDKSKKVIGFSLKKNNHHGTDNFISSAYKINSFYEDKMINKDGTFKDKKINCISKLGHCLHDIDKVFKKFSYYHKIKKLIKLANINNPILNQSSYIFKQPFFRWRISLASRFYIFTN